MSATPHGQPDAKPISDLLQDAMSNVRSILRSEIRLARTEVGDDAKQMGIGGGLLVAAGVLSLYALAILMSALTELLEEVMPEWLAELVVGVGLLAIAAALALAGRERIRQSDPVPHETITSLREEI